MLTKKQEKATPSKNTNQVVSQPTIAEKPETVVKATIVEKVEPSVHSKPVSGATKTVSVKPNEPKINPSESSKSASQAAQTEKSQIPTQKKTADKVKPAGGSIHTNEAAKVAPLKPIIATTEAKTTPSESIKPSSQATITDKTKSAGQAATVGKVKPAVENQPVGEVREKVLGVKPNESKKPENHKVVEDVKFAEQRQNNETKKLAAASATTETKNSSEMTKPVEKTSEASEAPGNLGGQAAHSLGGESANQFTPPLPEDFLKKAHAGERKQDNGPNIPSRVNSQIPSTKPLEGKTEDLLMTPAIPRPKKRPAAKSLLKQLGQAHATRPLKKVKSVKAKTENKSAGRAKSSPGRGRAPKPKSPAPRSPSSKKAKLLSEGPPTESLEGGWPEGWVKKVFERVSGATKGTTDKYWYSPTNGVRLRSIIEVRRFMKALKKTNGDENEAKKIMKTITL